MASSFYSKKVKKNCNFFFTYFCNDNDESFYSKKVKKSFTFLCIEVMSGFYSKEVKLENDESDGDGNGVDASGVFSENIPLTLKK